MRFNKKSLVVAALVVVLMNSVSAIGGYIRKGGIEKELMFPSSHMWWRDRHPRVPKFLATPFNATAVAGESAFLPCSVEHLADRSVTWMRRRDLHILTAGIFTYSADDRFKVLHPDNSDDWTLQIRFVTTKDSGVYECQVNSDLKIYRRVTLYVKEASQLDDPGMFREYDDINHHEEREHRRRQRKRCKRRLKKRRQTFNTEEHHDIVDQCTQHKNSVSTAAINGPAALHIQEGSALALTCVVRHHPRRPPKHLLWFKGHLPLDYNSPRGGVSVQTEKHERRTVSKLSVSDITVSDSGDYTCSPTNLPPASVTVHVQNGQHHAAVYQSGMSGTSPKEHYKWTLKCSLAILYIAQQLSCSTAILRWEGL